jgi:hypothetical protein
VNQPARRPARRSPAERALSRRRVAASVLWALLPVLTFGLATVGVFAYAAIRLRSWALGGSGLAYLAATVAGSIIGSSAPPNSAADNVSAIIVFAVIPLASCGHAFAVRQRVFGLPPFAAVATERTRRRERARKLLRRHPERAVAFGIGRPDLRLDRYEDGGLLDINHVPAEFIVTVLRLDRETADRITQARENAGSFTSAEDLAIKADLPYDLIDNVKDRLLFL